MSAKIVYYTNGLISDAGIEDINANALSEYADTDNLLLDDYIPDKIGSFEQDFMCAGESYRFADSSSKLAYEGTVMSGSDGRFSNTPIISITFYSGFNTYTGMTCEGVTLFFSEYRWIYAKSVKLTWIRDNGGTVSKVFSGITESAYYCNCADLDIRNCVSLKIEFLENHPNQYARLYKLTFGRNMVFSGENDEASAVNVTISTSANMVADEIEVNTSGFTLMTGGKNLTSLYKNQKYEIYYGDKYMATHYTSKITREKDSISIEGVDLFSLLDNHSASFLYGYTPERPHTATFSEWIDMMGWSLGWSLRDKITFDSSLGEIKISGGSKDNMTAREALTALCLAAGAYIDTTVDNKIHVYSTRKLFNSLDPVTSIPETKIFAGDTYETKEIYGSLMLRYNCIDDNGVESEVIAKIANPYGSDSTAVKEFELQFYPYDDDIYNHPNLTSLAKLYAGYYFKSDFYNAKSVVGYEKPGELITINGQNARIYSRKVNLDGYKLIAEGVYKLVD